MPPETGKVALEALLSRAQMIFTTAYKYQGEINEEQLNIAFEKVVNSIAKFSMVLNYRSQSDFDWIPSPHSPGKRFHYHKADDLDLSVKELCSRAFEFRQISNQSPVNLILVYPETDLSTDEFVIVLQFSHDHADAVSSEVIYQMIIDYYNASLDGDQAAAQAVLVKAAALRTVPGNQLPGYLAVQDYNLNQNVVELNGLESSDVGQYRIPKERFPELVSNLSRRKRMPTGFFVETTGLLNHCRRYNPKVSRIAAMSAVLHKALYNINVKYKNKPENHNICGRIVSDVLTPELREKIIGNYFSFVPVVIPGQLPIEEIAHHIHSRIMEMKAKKLDLTCFQMVEFAASQNMLGHQDMEYSYAITNWCNHHFVQGKSVPTGCEPLVHLSVANYFPLDDIGSFQLNKVTAGSNISFNGKAYFSMLPSFESEDGNQLIETEVASIFKSFI